VRAVTPPLPDIPIKVCGAAQNGNIRLSAGGLRIPPRAPRTMRVGKLVSPMGANERGDWAAVV